MNKYKSFPADNPDHPMNQQERVVKEIQVLPYQKKFLSSTKRFPALIAGIGTGKTFMMLLKIWNFLNMYPKSQGMIIRKEYTDLRDSTMKDFSRYFDVQVDSNKEYKLSNGSVLMFRHAEEFGLAVLKNITLEIAGIEQADEFETNEQFVFLRDRMRGPHSPYQQIVLIANAHGHNWVWKDWVNNPPSEEYDTVIASTFENERNLPKGFIDDLKAMEREAPNHYRQYVLNSFEEVDSDDTLLRHEEVYESPKLEFMRVPPEKRIMAVDVARFGQDEIVYTIIESRGVLKWEQICLEALKGKSLMETTGKIIEMQRTFNLDAIVIDDTGVGGGVTDRLREMRIEVIAYKGAEKSMIHANRRAEGYFKLQEYFQKGWLKILPDEKLMEQLLAIRYKFRSNGDKLILSKDEIRKEGLKSPDRADSLMMALAFSDKITTEVKNLPGYARTDQDIDLKHKRILGGLPEFAMTN